MDPAAGVRIVCKVRSESKTSTVVGETFHAGLGGSAIAAIR